MKKCPYCERTLKFWQFRCRLCNRFIWRIPQILIVLVSISIAILAVVLVVDYIAVNNESIEKKNEKQPGAVRERPRYNRL
jgi:glutaredoxin